MKKLYKQSFHAVLHVEEEELLEYTEPLFDRLSRYCGLSDSKPEEIKTIEDLPEGWIATEDCPTTEITSSSNQFFDIHPLTIKEILDKNRLNDLEEENKKLKEENQKLQSRLRALLHEN